ncbi:MAG: GNAT family N-acetyltransferase [Rubrivivax sp.]|nr:GNAT family N-acetyltransferase [Rubrivivax sp.]
MDDAAMAPTVERSELVAFEDLVRAAAGTAAQPLVRCWRQGADGLVVQAPSLPMTLFNRVFGLGLQAGPDDALLADLAARQGGERSPRFAVQPAPGALGDAWRARLQALGWQPRLQSLVQMARDLVRYPQAALPPAPGLTVREAGADEAERFAATAVAGFGMPPWFVPWLARLPGRAGWHCLVAERDGRPVGAAALFVQRLPGGDGDGDIGGIGWLGIAATLREHRGLGVQRSLMQARLALATRLGCRVATTETGAPESGQPHPSYSNMLGCGFRQVALRTSWAPPV